MSSCGYTHALCRKDGENATSRRKELLAKLPSYRSCRYTANMRTSCGGVCVGESPTAFGSPRAAENQFRAPAWTGHRLPKFANFVKCRASRMRTRCYKPDIPGVILVHNGFVWPERTPRHCFTYIGLPNGPIQRPKPVRYAQCECYEATARSETTRKLARVRPARCPAWGIWPQK
jgi:hypothetical protein